LASSTGEAKRKIAENAVSVNGEKVAGKFYVTEREAPGPVLRLGKKSVRVEWVG
jgi:tyrosyl-tRNA synthetase